ncbi:MAG: 2-oxoglutarate-dependent dioxygenase, partial [Variovorax sp.]
MISSELRAWVAAQRADGHTVAALRSSMRDAGWQPEVAEAALAEVDPEVAAAVAAPTRTAMPGPALDGAPMVVDAGDRRVRVLQTLRHPRVIVFGDLLADEECDALIAAAR